MLAQTFASCQIPLPVKSWQRLCTFVSAERSNAPTIICNALISEELLGQAWLGTSSGVRDWLSRPELP
jgi:hypothetical protein